MNLGLSVIIRNEKEYNRLQEFLGKEILYIDWQPLMAENKTGIVVFSKHKDFSIGTVGDAVDQSICGLRTIEFSEFFKTQPTTPPLSAELEYHGKTLEYWKQNAEEDYIKVPISVLKYITVLESFIPQPTPTPEVSAEEYAESVYSKYRYFGLALSDEFVVSLAISDLTNTITALELAGVDATYYKQALEYLKNK